MNIRDKDLITAVRKGDKIAYSRLYKAYSPKLCRYVYSLSFDYEQAEDITQEILMELWIKRKTLNIKSSLNNYLYRIAHNKFINDYRKHIKKQSLLDNLYAEAIIEYEGLEKDIKEARLIALENAINQLPPKRKEIFILSKLKNYKYREIAEMRNISENTVETHIRTALKTIRKEMLKLSFSGIFVVIAVCFYYYMF